MCVALQYVSKIIAYLFKQRSDDISLYVAEADVAYRINFMHR